MDNDENIFQKFQFQFHLILFRHAEDQPFLYPVLIPGWGDYLPWKPTGCP